MGFGLVGLNMKGVSTGKVLVTLRISSSGEGQFIPRAPRLRDVTVHKTEKKKVKT